MRIHRCEHSLYTLCEKKNSSDLNFHSNSTKSGTPIQKQKCFLVYSPAPRFVPFAWAPAAGRTTTALRRAGSAAGASTPSTVSTYAYTWTYEYLYWGLVQRLGHWHLLRWALKLTLGLMNTYTEGWDTGGDIDNFYSEYLCLWIIILMSESAARAFKPTTVSHTGYLPTTLLWWVPAEYPNSFLRWVSAGFLLTILLLWISTEHSDSFFGELQLGARTPSYGHFRDILFKPAKDQSPKDFTCIHLTKLSYEAMDVIRERVELRNTNPTNPDMKLLGHAASYHTYCRQP